MCISCSVIYIDVLEKELAEVEQVLSEIKALLKQKLPQVSECFICVVT